MQYFGGKCRIANKLIEIINSHSPKVFLEPFLGGCNILPGVNSEVRIGSDICVPLISLYRSLQAGWVPPDQVSEQEYQQTRFYPDPWDPRTAFIGFGCSYSGKWFGGYARAGKRNYALNAKNSLIKKFSRVKVSDIFLSCDFKEWSLPGIENAVVYCDPPYRGCTAYDYCYEFSSDEFWEWCRHMSKKNVVLVSEYQAPEDFKVVAEFNVVTDIRGEKGRLPRVERLFGSSFAS